MFAILSKRMSEVLCVATETEEVSNDSDSGRFSTAPTEIICDWPPAPTPPANAECEGPLLNDRDRDFWGHDLEKLGSLNICMCMTRCLHTYSPTHFLEIGVGYSGRRLQTRVDLHDLDFQRRHLITEATTDIIGDLQENGDCAPFQVITGLDVFESDVRNIYRDVDQRLHPLVISAAYMDAPVEYRARYERYATLKTDVALCQHLEAYVRQKLEWMCATTHDDPERIYAESVLPNCDDWFSAVTETLRPLKHGWTDHL